MMYLQHHSGVSFGFFIVSQEIRRELLKDSRVDSKRTAWNQLLCLVLIKRRRAMKLCCVSSFHTLPHLKLIKPLLISLLEFHFDVQFSKISTISGLSQQRNCDSSDPSPVWRAKCCLSPKNHSLFPPQARKQVMTVLMMAAKRRDGTPRHPDSSFHTLPKDVLFLILVLQQAL